MQASAARICAQVGVSNGEAIYDFPTVGHAQSVFPGAWASICKTLLYTSTTHWGRRQIDPAEKKRFKRERKKEREREEE